MLVFDLQLCHFQVAIKRICDFCQHCNDDIGSIIVVIVYRAQFILGIVGHFENYFLCFSIRLETSFNLLTVAANSAFVYPTPMWKKKNQTQEEKRGFKFDPLPDITAFELATILPLIVQKGSLEWLEQNVDRLPPECRRHISIIPPSDKVAD